MNLSKTLLILFTITFLLPTALAQVEGSSFYVQSNIQNPTLCTCDDLLDQIQIINTGIYDATYSISTNIEASIGQSLVVIKAGESQTIPVLISGSCGSETFQQDYQVTVNSNIGGQQTLQRTLNQVECQTIDTTLYASNQSVGPCQPYNYTISLTNPSTFTETYNISSNQEAITLNNQSFTVQGGQTVLKNATANFSCDVYGTQNIQFDVNAQTSQLESQLNHDITIERNYNFTLESPDFGMCKFEEDFRAITITNNKDFTNNYTLQLRNAPRYLSLQNTTISVPPQSSELIRVNIASIEEDSQGTFRLLATSQLGLVVEELNIAYNTRNCYDLNLNYATQQTRYCPGEYEIPINITNLGENNTYILQTNQAGLSENEVALQANQTTTITAFLNNQNQEGIEDVTQTISATPTQANTTRNLANNRQIQFYSQQACTQPQINNDIKAAYNQDNITINLQNTGIRQTRYVITTQNTPSFIQVANTSYVLEPNQRQTITLQLNATIEDIGNYNFTTTLTSNQNNQAYTETINLQITNKPILERLSQTITSSDCAPITTTIIMIAVLILVGVIATRFSKKRYNKGKVLGVLLILTAIFLMIAAISFGAPILSQNEENTIIIENQTTLIMSNVFDSNQSNASYEVVTQPTGFTVNITNNQANIRRNSNFEGTNQIRFSSTQNNQTQISLPYLLTTQTNDISLYELNCGWINTLLAIVALLLLAFLPGIKNSNNTKEPNTNKKESKEKKENKIRAPNKNNTKKEMKNYLDQKGIKYKSSDLKKDLYEKVKKEKNE